MPQGGVISVARSPGFPDRVLPGVLPSGARTFLPARMERSDRPPDLLEWLCPLGFCAGAPFDGIAPGVFITAALHGAKVIVDEKGTEAAAATALGFETSGPPPADLTVVADHPFLWAIVHKDTGAVLFLGRLVDPTV